MLRKANDLRHCGIVTRDGMAGEIEDFYFDDVGWKIRYFVITTHVWGTRQLLLVPPASMHEKDAEPRHFAADLSSAEVLASPMAEADPPVYVQRETQRERAETLLPLFGVEFTRSLTEAERDFYAAEAAIRAGRSGEYRSLPDPHLRSINHVLGYRAAATDGVAGRITEFLLDSRTWNIAYAVVEPFPIGSGRQVLIGPECLARISWRDGLVFLALSRDAVASAPQYDPARPLTLDYAERIHEAYVAKGKSRASA